VLIEETVALLERDVRALLCSDVLCDHRCTRVREKLSRDAGARGREAEAGRGG
jgi:hypothetical protein